MVPTALVPATAAPLGLRGFGTTTAIPLALLAFRLVLLEVTFGLMSNAVGNDLAISATPSTTLLVVASALAKPSGLAPLVVRGMP